MTDRVTARRSVGEYAWRVAPDAVVLLAGEIDKLREITPEDVGQISSLMHDPAVRHETALLLERWRSADAGSPTDLASVLSGAAEAVRAKSATESASLVWSGPTPERV